MCVWVSLSWRLMQVRRANTYTNSTRSLLISCCLSSVPISLACVPSGLSLVLASRLRLASLSAHTPAWLAGVHSYSIRYRYGVNMSRRAAHVSLVGSNLLSQNGRGTHHHPGCIRESQGNYRKSAHSAYYSLPSCPTQGNKFLHNNTTQELLAVGFCLLALECKPLSAVRFVCWH